MEIIIKIEDAENQIMKMDPGDDRFMVSGYAKVFDERSPKWLPDSEYNQMHLTMLQQDATQKLKSNGYIFLNEVYEMLGLPKTKAGQVVGWTYDEKNPIGDNFVDFDIYSIRNADFINGYKNSVLLDFNVDGVILDKCL